LRGFTLHEIRFTLHANMAKDINIHLKTTGADKTKADLDRIAESAKRFGDQVGQAQQPLDQAAQSAKELGDKAAESKQELDQAGQSGQQAGEKTAEGQQKATAATEQTTGKLNVMGRLFNTLKSQVMGFITAFLGIQAVIKIVTYLIEKLERVAELQKDIYEKSLQFAEMGQRLEFQTGTIGKQQFWTQQAIDLQKAGGLQGPEVAQQMLISMDIAFADLGGIKDKAIRDLAKQLGPFVGAAGLGPEEVSKAFEFAGTAGIKPTAEAYKDYFAKLQAGFTASKATNFGQFMEGIQKGGTAYMTMGGTIEGAISTFAAARAVTANEALAATLVEQIARLSGGGYEKPRAAMEKALRIKWSDLSMDERTAAVLEYVRNLPEAKRTQTLVEQGFPQELTTGIGKMVSPEAGKTMEYTRRVVGDATAGKIDDIARSYMESTLGQARQSEATKAGRIVARGPQFASWQRRLDEAKTELEDRLSIGRDRPILDSLEPYLIAFEEMQKELQTPAGEIPESGPARRLWFDIRQEINAMHEWTWSYSLLRRGPRKGYEFSRRLDAQFRLQKPSESPSVVPPAVESPPPSLLWPPPEAQPQSQPGPVGPVSYNYDHRVNHITVFNPVVGMNKQDLRIEPPYLG